MMINKRNCFIRKNTPELKKDLSELGYKYGGRFGNGFNYPFLYCTWGKFYEYSHRPIEDSIDCSDNEELFLAILSLSDCSDINQWFVSETGSFVICSAHTFCPYKEGLSLDDCKLQWHKASVNELIQYFKT